MKKSVRTIPLYSLTISPLIIAGLMYICLRSPNTIINLIIHQFTSLDFGFKGTFPKWIVYSLPGALWLFSFQTAFLLITNSATIMKVFWLVLLAFIAFGIESAQMLNITDGVYDYMDNIAYLMATLLSFLLLFLFKKARIEPYKIIRPIYLFLIFVGIVILSDVYYP